MTPQSYLHELKLTLKLAIPIILTQLGQMGFGIMDTAMVGRLGAVPLGAAAFVNNVCNIPMVFIAGVCSAISVLTAQNFGAKNYKNCGAILNNGLLIVSIIALVLILIAEIFSQHLDLFAQPQEVLSESINYYHVMNLSILPLVLFFVLKNYCEALSRPTVPLVILMGGLCLNFILNWLLIYGKLGFPKLGLYGAGLATLYSRTAIVFILFVYIHKTEYFKKFLVPIAQGLEYARSKKLLSIGIPSGFQYLFEVAAFAGSGIMMGWIGTAELAAHQIVLQVASLTFMVSLGLSFATSVRIGQLMGQDNFIGLRRVGVGAFLFITVVMAAFGTILIVVKDSVPGLFINDEQVTALASQLFIIAALFQIFDGTQAIGVSALRGIQDVKIPTLITFTAYWIVALPLAYYLAFIEQLKHNGIWIALWAGLVVASILLIVRFLLKTKRLIQLQEAKI